MDFGGIQIWNYCEMITMMNLKKKITLALLLSEPNVSS